MRTIHTTTTSSSRSARRPKLGLATNSSVARSLGEVELWVLMLFAGGATVDEISAAVSFNREWVRQCILRTGLSWRGRSRHVDALAILRDVRRTGTLSLREVAARLNYAEETVRHCLSALGMAESVRRLLRLRRRAARRVATANACESIAAIEVTAIDARSQVAARVA
jgi:DeoR-like helix-turn-helix domain